MNQIPRHPTRSRRLKLAAHPAAVPWARRLLGQTLREWELTGLSDTALLLVSELVTNAFKASAACTRPGREPAQRGFIGLAVHRLDTCLLLEVWDASPAPPVLQEPDPATESGRGLLLVEALSSKWGQEPAAGGKVVWCEVELPAASADSACRCPA